MSQFDPQTFLDAQVTTVSEKRPPLPIENPADSNGLYTAIVGEPAIKTGTIGRGERQGQAWVSMNVPLEIQVPQQLQDAMKLGPKITITHAVFLDLDDRGQLDLAPGRNRGMRAYREALDMNKPGEPFAWKMIQGRPIKVKLTHETYEGAIQERVGAVLKML